MDNFTKELLLQAAKMNYLYTTNFAACSQKDRKLNWFYQLSLHKKVASTKVVHAPANSPWITSFLVKGFTKIV
jgi:hypothetical protein